MEEIHSLLDHLTEETMMVQWWARSYLNWVLVRYNESYFLLKFSLHFKTPQRWAWQGLLNLCLSQCGHIDQSPFPVFHY